MGSLGDALMREIAGGAPPASVLSVGAAARAFVGEAGSVAAASRDLGIPRSTLRGWLAGKQPRESKSWLVDMAQGMVRGQSLDPDREQRLRRPWALDGLRITGTYHYAGGGSMRGAEDRDVPIGDYLNDIADELVDAYLDGADSDELEEIFHSGINDGSTGFYRTTFDPDSPDGHWEISDLSGWA